MTSTPQFEAKVLGIASKAKANALNGSYSTPSIFLASFYKQ
jgi:hypothetical protein